MLRLRVPSLSPPGGSTRESQWIRKLREARPTLWGFNPEKSSGDPEEGVPIFPSLVQILQTGLHEDPPWEGLPFQSQTGAAWQ
jgi:hypothetical protein